MSKNNCEFAVQKANNFVILPNPLQRFGRFLPQNICKRKKKDNFLIMKFTISQIFNLLMIFFLLSFSSCKKEEDLSGYQDINIQDLYSMRLPAYLKATQMSPIATLQYCNRDSGLYVLVVEDAKENFGIKNSKDWKTDVKDYFRHVEKDVLHNEETESATFLDGKTWFYNDPKMQMQIGDYEVVVNREGKEYKLFYRIAVAENATHFFQILLWMPQPVDCKKSEFLDEILSSFKANVKRTNV